MKALIFALMICAGLVKAQTKFDKNIIDHGIYLSQTNDMLNMAIDNRFPILYNYMNGKVIYASAKSENVNILMQYVNPLKMKYDITYSSRINPDVENIVKFFDKLTPVFENLGFTDPGVEGLKKINIPSIPTGTTAINGQSFGGQNFSVVFTTRELNEMALHVIDHPDYYINTRTGNNKTTESTAGVQTLTNNIQLLRDNEIDFTEIRKRIKSALETLINADSPDAVKDALSAFPGKLQAIKDEKQVQQGRLTKVATFFGTTNEEEVYRGNVAPTSTLDVQQVFSAKVVKGHREYLVGEYKSKVEQEFREIDEIISRITELGKKFRDALNYYYVEDQSLKIAEIPINSDDIKDVQITIRIYDVTLNESLKLDITEKHVLKGQISLKEHSLLSVDFGAGLLYPFDFGYNKYATRNNTDGSMTIVSAKPERINFVAGWMLNLIFKTRTYPAFPLLQLGVGYGKDIPTLFVGAGAKFMHNVALSGGIITGWYKELNNLEVGSTIAGSDELVNDYVYRPVKKPSFYIGIHYSF